MSKSKFKVIPVNEPGWRAVVAALDLSTAGDRTDKLYVDRLPVVGWLVQPDPDGDFKFPYLAPMVYPAAHYFSTQALLPGDCVDAEPLSEIVSWGSGFVGYVLASWQDEPSEEQMRADAEEARKNHDIKVAAQIERARAIQEAKAVKSA